MTDPSPPSPAAAPPGLRVAAAVLAAATLLALVDVGAIALTIPRPTAGVPLRVAHLAFDVVETFGVGAVAAILAGAVARLVRAPRGLAYALGVAATAAILDGVIGENITRGVQFTVPGRFAPVARVAYAFGIALAIPGACAIGMSLGRRPVLRFLPVAIAVVVMAGDHVPFFDDYQGVHGVLACGAALFAGGALAPTVEGWLAWLAGRARGRVALAALALVAALGVAVPPPNAVRYELFRQPCAVAPWVLATLLWRAPPLHGHVAPQSSPWARDRSRDPAVPATSPAPLPEDAVIVLLTIDATRANDVFDPANAALFPTFTKLAREGVVFTRAMAPGTQTPLSIATVFSGRTFSEQLWTEHGTETARFLYPADDTSARFPELLAARGVRTFDVAGLIFLANEFGVARGFREERVAVQGTRHAMAVELVDPLLERLRQAPPGPSFLFTHLLEPHEPYNRGRKKDGTPHERYLSEVAVADLHVGRVLSFLQHRYGKRWALFVSSDHGEAFGEHGTHEHAKSLYEELLHVPLFAVSPAFPPRVIDERVSLVDLGPTILDLFGAETPATFLGQSLVPLLTGGRAELTRPLFAEGRLRRSMTSPDGLKVIEDLRRKVVEVYDLERDPRETTNLFDVDPARADPALAALRAFFEAHTRTEGGYRPPFKP